MSSMFGQRALLQLSLSTLLIVGPSCLFGTQTAPDNTKANQPGNSGSGQTADQSKNNSTDRELAAKIRRDVVKDKSLSMYGHNVKIIASGGKVTLKGPVHSDEEKKTIVQYAQKYAGDGNVVDQITVAGSK